MPTQSRITFVQARMRVVFGNWGRIKRCNLSRNIDSIFAPFLSWIWLLPHFLYYEKWREIQNGTGLACTGLACNGLACIGLPDKMGQQAIPGKKSGRQKKPVLALPSDNTISIFLEYDQNFSFAPFRLMLAFWRKKEYLVSGKCS